MMGWTGVTYRELESDTVRRTHCIQSRRVPFPYFFELRFYRKIEIDSTLHLLAGFNQFICIYIYNY